MLRSGLSLLFVLLLSALLSACGDVAEPPAESLTASPATTPTAAPSRRPDLGPGTLVFLRGDSDPEPPQAGAIWVSDFRGESARQVTPQELITSYLGLSHSKSGGSLLYYATQDSGTTTVRSIDLDTGVTMTLLSYPDLPKYYSASVSPDGRYLVHTSPTSLDMHDFATGSDVTLFQSGSGPECTVGAIEECYRAVDPHWSPDGRLLSVVHSVYEGGWAEVVDPFQYPPAVLTSGDREYPSQAFWSPVGDAACAHGKFAALSGLYLLESPDWEARNLFPEFEDYAANPDARQVVACDWLNENEVVFVTMVERPQRQGELQVYDRETGQTRLIVTLPEGTGCCGGALMAVPGTAFVVAQVLQLEGGSEFVMSRPAVVDVRTSETQHILEKDDIILDALSP